MELGDNIKKNRLNKGISQKDFAKLLNIPVSTLANYENNHREPKTEMLKKIAKALDVSLLSLVESEEIDIEEKRLKKLENEVPEADRNLIRQSPSTTDYMNSSWQAIDELREFLKSDVMQKDCGYKYKDLEFRFDIDDIYIYIQDMLRIKIAKNLGNTKTKSNSNSIEYETLENYIFTEGYDIRKLNDKTLIEIKRKFKDILELEFYKLDK